MLPFTRSRSITKSLAICLGILVLVVSFLYLSVYWQTRSKSASELSRANAGISKDLAYLSEQGDEVAKIPDLVLDTESGNSDASLAFLLKEKDARGIGQMGLADKNGYVISRTKSQGLRGDNIFLSTAIGRALSNGKDKLSSIETSSYDPRQVLLTTSRYLVDGEERVGVLFTNYLADDAYTKQFVQKYLSAGTEVAFYNKDYGLYGTSLDSVEAKKQLDALLNPNSDLVKKHSDYLKLELVDGKRYVLRNIPLQGLESETGGMIVLVPVGHRLVTSALLFMIPVLFVLIAFYLHRKRSSEAHQHNYYLYLARVAVALCLLAIALFIYFSSGYLKVTSYRYPLYNSVLRFVPQGGVYSSKYTKKVDIVVDSGGEAVNAIGVHIDYDANDMQVPDISMDNSVCINIIEQSIDPVAGHIDISCVIPNPGFSSESGNVATITIQGLHQGIGWMRFDKDSQVLANDGLGTNVLRTVQNASFQFTDEEDDLAKDTDPLLFSPSHPSLENWYSNRSIKFNWLPHSPAILGVHKEGDATTTWQYLPVAIASVSYTAPSDGIYEFTLDVGSKAASSSPIRYTAHIDTTPPEELDFRASEMYGKVDETIRFTASGSDAGSGLQRTLYLKIDKDLFYPVGNEIYIPFKKKGIHAVTVRAYDKAGNYTERTLYITID